MGGRDRYKTAAANIPSLPRVSVAFLLQHYLFVIFLGGEGVRLSAESSQL